MKAYGVVIFAAALLGACTDGKVKLSGRFVGSDKQSVYLEKVAPGSQNVVDSVVTDEKGYFKFNVKLEDAQPTIFNLRYKGELIPLLLAPGERVRVNSVGNIVQNYTVSGSEGSEQMRELKKILSEGATRLDSIMKIYAKADVADRQPIAQAYAEEYIRAKREHIKFIVSNSGSLAALFGLYQRLPNDETLFNGEGDMVYYRMVADSVAKTYPDSPYLKALQQQIAASDKENNVARMIQEKLAEEPASYPEVEMADMYGTKHKLSDLEGKVFLLDFWSAASTDAKLNNAEYKQYYEEWAPRGFEIYQVAVDESKPVWINSVQDQKLPWITVCDFKGAAGSAVMLYNVKSVPANFLFDREGNIVGKNLYGEALANKLEQLLK